jgi:hypothetical protein
MCRLLFHDLPLSSVLIVVCYLHRALPQGLTKFPEELLASLTIHKPPYLGLPAG